MSTPVESSKEGRVLIIHLWNEKDLEGSCRDGKVSESRSRICNKLKTTLSTKLWRFTSGANVEIDNPSAEGEVIGVKGISGTFSLDQG